MIAIRGLLEEFDGDVSDSGVEELIDKLFDAEKENQEAFNKKVDSYLYLIKDLRGDAEKAKKESDRLAARAKRANSHADSLESRLEYVFRRLGITERKTNYHTLKFGKVGGKQKLAIDLTGWSLDPDGEGQPIPDYYIDHKAELSVERIREDLENGTTLPFAHLEERKEKLKIK